MNAVARQDIFAGRVRFLDDLLHVRIEIREETLFFLGQFTQEIIVGSELLIVGIRQVFANHSGGEDDNLDPGLLRRGDNFGDVFLVLVQRHAVRTVPDIVDPAAQSHPVGFLAENITIQTTKHVVGFVSTDSSRHRLHLDTVGFQSGDDAAHVTAGIIIPATLRDGIAEERELFSGLNGHRRGDRMVHRGQPAQRDGGGTENKLGRQKGGEWCFHGGEPSCAEKAKARKAIRDKNISRLAHFLARCW